MLFIYIYIYLFIYVIFKGLIRGQPRSWKSAKAAFGWKAPARRRSPAPGSLLLTMLLGIGFRV